MRRRKWITLPICGRKWPVYIVSADHPMLEGNEGMCRCDLCEIYISADLDDVRVRGTAIHEALHAVIYTMGALKYDERLVSTIAPVLYATFTEAKMVRFPKVPR